MMTKATMLAITLLQLLQDQKQMPVTRVPLCSLVCPSTTMINILRIVMLCCRSRMSSISLTHTLLISHLRDREKNLSLSICEYYPSGSEESLYTSFTSIDASSFQGFDYLNGKNGKQHTPQHTRLEELNSVFQRVLNQLTSQQTKQPTDQPANRPNNQQTNQPIDQITKRPRSQQTNQPMDQPTNQPSVVFLIVRLNKMFSSFILNTADDRLVGWLVG